MRAVRLRRTLLLLGIAVLAAAVVPPFAQADNGGAQAPAADTTGTTAGSSGGVVAGEQSRTRAKKKRTKAKRPARKRSARRRPARRRPARKRRAHRKPAAPAPTSEAGHVFPVAGPYDLGGADSRFGARRTGHRHQGQDIAAAEGTAVVAPHAGSVEFVRYQRDGAGWYVVLDGDDEDRDYVFMHLRRGSITVEPGQRVTAGQAMAQVGTTGSSSGAHLHFEIWVGGWYAGGDPIDPLPLLQQWSVVAPVS
jgi:murein DD-endopeptidase MepM/ murein hydrolase activator NlpD